jgi:hypothetical protein
MGHESTNAGIDLPTWEENKEHDRDSLKRMKKKIAMNKDFNISEMENSWGVVITYSTPEEKEEIIEELDRNIDNLQRRNLDDLDEFNPAIGVVNCVDISGQEGIMLAESGAGKRVMGWVKAHKIIILCKTWEWELLNSRDSRWTSHLDSVHESERVPFKQAAENLLETRDISDRQNRLVIYEYLQERSLFTEFLSGEGLPPNTLQSIIDSKGLWSLSETEQDLLFRPNNELLRYVAAQELRDRRGGRFRRQDFSELFGDIPRRINAQSDDQVFEDILEGISPGEFTINQYTEIQVLTGVLRREGFEDLLEKSIRDTLDSDPEKILNQIQQIENKELFLARSGFIAENIASDSTRSAFTALCATVALEVIDHGESALEIYERYREGVTSEDKARVSIVLTQKIKDDEFNTSYNYDEVAAFLDEEGPKIVILLDGLPTTAPETESFLSNRETDQRWEIKRAIAPVPSVTKVFMPQLSKSYNFKELGGFSNGEDRLTGIDLDAFLGEEREEELLEMLQNGKSVILYDTKIDQGAHYPTDIHRKIETHLMDNIPEFIEKYGDLADILITSDHGMVQTYESEAIPRPSEADQRGMRHCRGTFTDDIETVQREISDVNVSYIEVGLPDNNGDCVMVNPNNPNSKFGTQNSNLWIHGGVSVEESVVPVAIWRRD